MSGTVPNMVVVDGQIARLVVRKQKETQGSRLRRVFAIAKQVSDHFTFKHSGVWHLYRVRALTMENGFRQFFPEPVRTFPNEDAAAMWLLHRAMRP